MKIQYKVRAPFCKCLHRCSVAAWHFGWGVTEVQPSAGLWLFGQVFLISLLTIPRRFSEFRSGELAQHQHVQQIICSRFWLSGQVLSPLGKGSLHLHKPSHQREAWSALKSVLTLDLIQWTYHQQQQQMTWKPKPSQRTQTSPWSSKTLYFVPLHSSSRI